MQIWSCVMSVVEWNKKEDLLQDQVRKMKNFYSFILTKGKLRILVQSSFICSTARILFFEPYILKCLFQFQKQEQEEIQEQKFNSTQT